MKPKFKLAVVQIRTETDKEKTFAKAEKMISEAADNGAELVVLTKTESRLRVTEKYICLT